MVTAVDPAAAALGLRPGLPLADARALYPALGVRRADPMGEAADLARLAAWCGRWSPWTAAEGSDGIWLDITGCAHLRGGEAALAGEVMERLQDQGIAARAAIADTAGAAWAVARHGQDLIVAPGKTKAALGSLPTAGLRLPPLLVAELDRLGLRRIGELLVLPRADLVARFGETLVGRLDQALDEGTEPLSPLSPKPQRWTRRRFAEPISRAEDLAAVLAQLMEALCDLLAREGLGARQLVLSCYRVDGRVEQAAIGTARASRDAGHLTRLLAERIETIDPGLGIEDMVLAATEVESLGARQFALRDPRLAPPSGAGAEVGFLIDRLANRLGCDAVIRFEPQESHLPERASQAVAVLSATGISAWPSNRLRPIRLLPRPEPILAVASVPDDPPLSFRWRQLSHRVARADGPERIGGEWWRKGGGGITIRDYYRVEDEEGRRFWLYRAGLFEGGKPTRWFLHGIFA